MLNIFPKYKNIETGKTSYIFNDVISDNVEIDLKFIHKFSTTLNHDNETFIKNIIIDYEIPNEKLLPQKPIKQSEYIEKVLKALKENIIRTWDPERNHLMFHSGGYDSRVISYILSQLREEKGKDWIGKLNFICWEPEGDIFKQIMKFEGWNESQYHIYNECIEDKNYQNDIIEFSNCWKHSNGSCPPVVLFSAAYNQFKEIIGDNPQIYQALYFNEVFRRPYIYFKEQFSRIYFRNPIIQQFTLHEIPFIPVVSEEVSQIVMNFRTELKNLRIKILETLCPELYKLPNVNVDNEKNPYRALNTFIYQKCIKDYLGSYFYNHTNIHPEKFNNKHIIWKYEWWFYYNVASWIEYLNKTKKIKICE